MITPITAFFIVDSLVQNWTTSYRQMLKWLRGGKLTPQDSTSLHNIAMLCSDEFGDGIHVARAIMGQYNDVYYDTYDDCNTASQSGTLPRSVIDRLMEPDVSIYPNPNNGSFTLDFPNKQTGIVEIYTMGGKLLTRVKYADVEQTSITVTGHIGMVLIRIEQAAQTPILKRAIILQ